MSDFKRQILVFQANDEGPGRGRGGGGCSEVQLHGEDRTAQLAAAGVRQQGGTPKQPLLGPQETCRPRDGSLNPVLRSDREQYLYLQDIRLFNIPLVSPQPRPNSRTCARNSPKQRRRQNGWLWRATRIFKVVHASESPNPRYVAGFVVYLQCSIKNGLCLRRDPVVSIKHGLSLRDESGEVEAPPFFCSRTFAPGPQHLLASFRTCCLSLLSPVSGE